FRCILDSGEIQAEENISHENAMNDEMDKGIGDINGHYLCIEENYITQNSNIEESQSLLGLIEDDIDNGIFERNGESFFCRICKVNSSNIVELKEHVCLLIHKILLNSQKLDSNWLEWKPINVFNCNICNINNIKGILNLINHITSEVHFSVSSSSNKPEMILKDGYILNMLLLIEASMTIGVLTKKSHGKYFCNRCSATLSPNLIQCRMHLEDPYHFPSVVNLQKMFELPRNIRLRNLLHQKIYFQCPICMVKINNLKLFNKHFNCNNHLLIDDIVQESLKTLFKTSIWYSNKKDMNTARKYHKEEISTKKNNEIFFFDNSFNEMLNGKGKDVRQQNLSSDNTKYKSVREETSKYSPQDQQIQQQNHDHPLEQNQTKSTQGQKNKAQHMSPHTGGNQSQSSSSTCLSSVSSPRDPRISLGKRTNEASNVVGPPFKKRCGDTMET
ncbi:unnamed protein product, partial [Meganyctiphanes norvegica]